MTLKQLIDFLTIKPAQAFKLNYGKIEIGMPADLVLLDLEEEQVINPVIPSFPKEKTRHLLA